MTEKVEEPKVSSDFKNRILPAIEGVLMDGKNYALFDPCFHVKNEVRFDLQFKTGESDGLILWFYDAKTNDSITVEFYKEQMKVDRHQYTRIEPHASLLNLKGPLFIGGYPDNIDPPYIAVRSQNFWKGGLRAFRINGNYISWLSNDETPSASPNLKVLRFDFPPSEIWKETRTKWYKDEF